MNPSNPEIGGSALVYGHSHTAALIQALPLAVAKGYFAGSDAPKVVSLNRVARDAGCAVTELVAVTGDRWRISPALTKALTDNLPRRGRPTVVSLVGGNAHLTMGLIAHDEPFDFILPTAPSLPLDPAATLIPAELVRATLRRRMRAHLGLMRAVTEQIDAFHVHLESPPPIGSDEHVGRNLDPYFRAQGKYTLAPRWLRYKLWRLHSEIVLEFCAQVGILFVAVPPESQDDEGFLVNEGFPDNATHANEWYGDRVLAQLSDLIRDPSTAAPQKDL